MLRWFANQQQQKSNNKKNKKIVNYCIHLLVNGLPYQSLVVKEYGVSTSLRSSFTSMAIRHFKRNSNALNGKFITYGKVMFI